VSNVTLEIGGRQFSVASADGEEEHVVKLGQMIDAKLRAMGGASGQSESRMMLFAALLLADEIHEIKARGGAPVVEDPSVDLDRVAQAIDGAADRIENIAMILERGSA